MRNTYHKKKCPRCGTKCNYNEFRCSGCGLIFSRVENGSNQLAKGLILAGKKDQTVKMIGYPKDVNKKKYLLLCGFLGLFGAHNFYVGKYFKAIFQIIMGILSVILTIFSGTFEAYSFIMSFIFVPAGINVFMWLFDFFDGCINKCRIPVAVDFTDGKNLLD